MIAMKVTAILFSFVIAASALTDEEHGKSFKDVSDDNNFDFRSKGDVTPVVDQRDCNSGYAFSVVAQLQSELSIFKGQKVVLSAQEIIDCSKPYGNDGCNGGTTANAFKYVMQNGISLDKDYPYKAAESTCQNTTHEKFPFFVTRVEHLPFVEEAVREAVEAYAPVSISLNSAPLNTYRGGILDPVGCNKTDLNHAVLLVGFGSENGTDYWTFQNSWGKGFGENGYFRMVRNGKSTCGMLKEPLWSLLGM